LLTIFLCTWASVHPNIPSPDERWPSIAFRRIRLMLAALIMPEAIFAWALRQRLAARRLAKAHEREGWTITHGFFAVMGGFMIYEGNRPIRVLLPNELQSYSLTGKGDFPRISKAEIKDKSKGDFISKAVVILQTGWFVIQCIARPFQGLQITQLELVTVAFATINFFIYVIWFEKPLDVQCGVRVYKKQTTDNPMDSDDETVQPSVGFWVALGDALSKLPSAIARGPMVNVSDPDSSWPRRVFVWSFIKTQQILGIEIWRQGCADLTKRVATFYPNTWEGSPFLGLFSATLMALPFGGIHCLGSSFIFPSTTEQIVWRSASASIVGVPIILFLWLYALLWVKDRYSKGPGFHLLRYILRLQVCAYFLCRFALLVLPFLCLRWLPDTAYDVVDWALFIPHIQFTS